MQPEKTIEITSEGVVEKTTYPTPEPTYKTTTLQEYENQLQTLKDQQAASNEAIDLQIETIQGFIDQINAASK